MTAPGPILPTSCGAISGRVSAVHRSRRRSRHNAVRDLSQPGTAPPRLDMDAMSYHTVLFSGVGIAGPTLAFWLRRGGFEPTLLECAPGLRSGGYVIDFWGLGYDIAERMGLADAIERVGYHMRELRIVDESGRRVAGFGTRAFRELTGGAVRDARSKRSLATAFRQSQRRDRDHFRRRDSFAPRAFRRCGSSIPTRPDASIWPRYRR